MPKITATGKLSGTVVIVSDEKEANSIYQRGYFGEMTSGGKLKLSLVEALYLFQKKRICVLCGKKSLSFEQLLEKAEGEDPETFVKYSAFEDLRERGHIVKTGFKFGAHFRVYEKGDTPGQAHANFIVHCIPENHQMSMTEISGIVRLGHSVKKTMWLAVVDNEGDITYYQLARITP